MKRRDFLKSTAVIAAAASTPQVLKASTLIKSEENEKKEEEAGGPLIISAPMLQNYAESSIGVAFAVSALANGYVLYGEKSDLSDAKKVKCGGYRLTDISDRVIQVRLTGLKSATKYYYKIGADRIEYGGGYKMKILSNEEDPRIYSFTTAGKNAEGHFCVINDTHVKWDPFGRAIEKVAEISPSCVIWNGDASNTEETIEAQMRIFLTPEIDRKDYATETPYLFCPGNHDSRGWANRHLEKVWMYRQPEERDSRDWDLGRNFAVRMGDIAMIGLDTAEDKLDTNPRFAGLFNSGAYREAQVAWLADALKKKEIASAPHLVAFCHIPLFDPDPKANPGDIAPDDTDPFYHTDYAAWQRTCAGLWCPLLEKAGCSLIITAHQHRYRFDAPDSDRPWAQIVGGGPNLGVAGKGDKRHEDSGLFPTVIEGLVEEGGKLKINVHNLLTGKIMDTFTFAPRKRRRSRLQ